MKNAINYYYNLVSYDIHQANRNYFFSVENTKYILYECDLNINEISEIYKISSILNQYKIPYHQIILNNQNQILTIINNSNYVLLKIFVENYEINLNEILRTNIYVNERITTLKRKEWFDLWSHKIDFIEYQYAEYSGKLGFLKSSLNYYIGMAETAVSLAKDIKKGTKSISHRRITCKETNMDLYNPLNIIIDYKVRDACEYFKSKFFYEELKYNEISLYLNTLNADDIYIFFTRMIFPSYYFDIFEKILDKNEDAKRIEKIISKTEDYEKLLQHIYNYIKQIIKINEIEWLTKNVG